VAVTVAKKLQTANLKLQGNRVAKSENRITRERPTRGLGRNPKAERRPKSEIRNAKLEKPVLGDERALGRF
jgi:hypothetical protein